MPSRSMRKVTLFTLFFLFSFQLLWSQRKGSLPEDHLSSAELASHLRFLASDEMLGRMTGTNEINIAARYVAEQFRMAGVLPVPGLNEYYQDVLLERVTLAQSGRLIIGKDTLLHRKEMIVARGSSADLEAELVFAGSGTKEELATKDLKGKILVTNYQGSSLATAKWKSAAEAGAVAVVELYRGNFPWQSILQFLGQSSFRIAPDGKQVDLPYLLLNDAQSVYEAALAGGGSVKGSIHSEGVLVQKVQARNVLGMVRGSDPVLREEYMLLMAHYDHVGAGLRAGATPEDTIFNGARDNAVGTVALMAAAKVLAAQPPARSVIFAAVTSEEVGLIGSSYLADHFPLPLEKLVYTHNTDGAGYNDTTVVTVIGLERTTAEERLKAGAARYGLGVIPDPAPEQNLFNRSDNVSFARKGVPAPNFGMGLRSFDAEIAKYYHRPADQADEHFDFTYFSRYCQAFAHAARLVADMKERPVWRQGDPYEEAGKKLYGR